MGEAKWVYGARTVQVNRTEALDASRRVIREGLVVLPRRTPRLEEFAAHMAADAKRLVEDEETGSQVYRYVRTGTNHFSLAFTYDCLAWSDQFPGSDRASILVGYLDDDEKTFLDEEF